MTVNGIFRDCNNAVAYMATTNWRISVRKMAKCDASSQTLLGGRLSASSADLGQQHALLFTVSRATREGEREAARNDIIVGGV